MRVGPGSFSPQYNLIEKSLGRGAPVIKNNFFQPSEEYLEIKASREGFPMQYYPNKPGKNRLTFKYYKPVDRKIKPQAKDEGRWIFYDVDLDAVREALAKNVYLAQNMTQKEFKEHQEFKTLLEEHIRRNNERRPEAGDYDAQKGMAEEEMHGVAWNKAQPRWAFESGVD
jgi:hypothetical protein